MRSGADISMGEMEEVSYEEDGEKALREEEQRLRHVVQFLKSKYRD